MNSQFQLIRSSLAHRKEVTIPPIKWLILLILLFLTIYLMLAVMVGPENNPEYHFIREKGAITALSAIFLAMASGFAGVSFFLASSSVNWLRYFWLLASFGFGFLALDELLQIHERMDDWIAAAIGDPQTFRNWNDVIVICYGIVALPILIYFLPEILRYPRIGETITIAFVFYCLHTGIDSIQEPKTTASVILEESAKLFCSAFSAISMFIAILGITVSKSVSVAK